MTSFRWWRPIAIIGVWVGIHGCGVANASELVGQISGEGAVVVLELLGCSSGEWIDSQVLKHNLEMELGTDGFAPLVLLPGSAEKQRQLQRDIFATIRLTAKRCVEPQEILVEFYPPIVLEKKVSLVGVPKELKPRVLALSLAAALGRRKPKVRSPSKPAPRRKAKAETLPREAAAFTPLTPPAPVSFASNVGVGVQMRFSSHDPETFLWGASVDFSTQLAVPKLNLIGSGQLLYRFVDTDAGEATGSWLGASLGIDFDGCGDLQCGFGPMLTVAWLQAEIADSASGSFIEGTLWALGVRGYLRSRPILGWRAVARLNVDKVLSGVVVSAGSASVLGLNGWMFSPGVAVVREF